MSFTLIYSRARQIRDEVADYIANALFVVEEVSSMFDSTRPPSVEVRPHENYSLIGQNKGGINFDLKSIRDVVKRNQSETL